MVSPGFAMLISSGNETLVGPLLEDFGSWKTQDAMEIETARNANMIAVVFKKFITTIFWMIEMYKEREPE